MSDTRHHEGTTSGTTMPGAIQEPVHATSVLDNGLTVCTFPMPWLHQVGATLLVRAGSRYEAPELSGIAHLLEHMLFKGTRAIPDPTLLHAHLESMAADMNAATGQEHNAYWITLPVEYLQEGFLCFCSIFTEPAFTALEVERGVVLAEMREDENERGDTVVPILLAGQHLWPGHPLARSVLGTRDSVQRIERTDLHRFLQRHYCGCNMIVAFFGPVAHEQSIALTQQALGKLPRGKPAVSVPPPPMVPGPHWVAVEDPTAQLTLSLYFRTEGFRSPSLYAMSALRRLLDDGFSSRLQATLRERRGLVYDIWAGYTVYSDTGALEMGASVSPENLLELFQALMHERSRLRDEMPTPEEWQRLMTRWRASLVASLDNPMELVERYAADGLFHAVEPLTEAWQRVGQLTPEQLPVAAREVTRLDQLVVVLVGPQARGLLARLKQCCPAE
jgi:predicted Zn-dependent peptidase